MPQVDEISGIIVDAAFRVHRDVGPGLLESVYENILASVLQKRGLTVERQKVVSFAYAGIQFDEACRVDLLVENQVVVELKSVEKLAPIHAKQLLTYLRVMHLQVGLLINFGSLHFRDGLQRIVNNYPHRREAPLDLPIP
jgi:GxxExxY protein